jgi:hypothetical protein
VLDTKPEYNLTLDSFGSAKEDLIKAANACYISLPGNYEGDQRAYFFTGKGVLNAYSDGSNVPTETNKVWDEAYKRIRRSNLLINNADNALRIESEEFVNRYKGEGLFFRAYSYFELVSHFGDVPYTNDVLTLESPELYGPRTDRAEVITNVISDLNKAADYLPVCVSAAEHGRITKSAALALLARVALFEGTWQKYHFNKDGKEFFTYARDAAKEVMLLDVNHLFNDYASLFLQVNETADEIIFSKKCAVNYGVHALSLKLDRYNRVPTKALADMYLDNIGLPITNEASVFEGYGTLNSEFIKRDPRMDAAFFIPGIDDKGDPDVPWKPVLDSQDDYTSTGYANQKGFNPAEAKSQNETVDIYIIRFAEVLLSYAEAVYELEGKISNDDLNLSINKLRDRVGMPHLTNEFVQEHDLDMLHEIRRERIVELACENHEFDDIRRWQWAETESKKALLGIKVRAEDFPGEDLDRFDFTPAGFLIVQKEENRTWDVKSYLYPLPLKDLRLNPALAPNNPGWD